MTVPGRRANGADPFSSNRAAGSAMFEADLSGVTSGPSWSIPVGVWPAKLTDVQNGTSNAGNRKFVWSLQVIGGPHRSKTGQFHTALTERAMWKVAETVEALDLGQAGQLMRFSHAEAVGRVCAIVVEDQVGTDNVTRPQITRLCHWSEFADDPIFVETAQRLGFSVEDEGEGAPPVQSSATPSRRGPGVPR